MATLPNHLTNRENYIMKICEVRELIIDELRKIHGFTIEEVKARNSLSNKTLLFTNQKHESLEYCLDIETNANVWNRQPTEMTVSLFMQDRGSLNLNSVNIRRKLKIVDGGVDISVFSKAAYTKRVIEVFNLGSKELKARQATHKISDKNRKIMRSVNEKFAETYGIGGVVSITGTEIDMVMRPNTRCAPVKYKPNTPIKISIECDFELGEQIRKLVEEYTNTPKALGYKIIHEEGNEVIISVDEEFYTSMLESGEGTELSCGGENYTISGFKYDISVDHMYAIRLLKD